MLRRKVYAKPLLAVAALILCAAIRPLPVDGQKPSRPLSKDDVIRLLKGEVSPKHVAEMARESAESCRGRLGDPLQQRPSLYFSRLNNFPLVPGLVVAQRGLWPQPNRAVTQPASCW